MPIYNGNYVAPVWVNNQPPAINETELLAMSQTIQASQILHGSGAPTQYTSGIAGQRYADTSTTPPTIYKLKAAAEDANVWELDDSEGNIALDYSSSATYSEGDYCIYAGALYKAAQDISTAESWTAAHWQRALVADDLADHVANQSNPHEVTAPQTGALPSNKIAFIEPSGKAENRVYYPGDCVVLFPYTQPSLHIVTSFIGYDTYFSIGNNVSPAVILTDVKANKDMLATVEDVQASKAYAVDDYLVKGGALYKVTQPIAQYGGIYTFGDQTNVVAVKLADEVAGLSGVINKPPRINSSGYWEVWDQNTNAYVSTGYSVVVNPPMVANTASEMTNHGQVYVYNGNESGYQHGYWYYWDGSAWTAGAAYQVAATDKTLTVADAAADAKATGDAVGDLKSAISQPGINLMPEINRMVTFTRYKVLQLGRSLPAGSYVLYAKVTSEASGSYSIFVAYNGSAYVSSFCNITRGSFVGVEFTTTGSFESIWIFSGTSSSTSTGKTATYEDICLILPKYSPLTGYVYPICARDDILRHDLKTLQSDVDNILVSNMHILPGSVDIDTLSIISTPQNLFNFDDDKNVSGYVNSSGNVVSNNSYKTSWFIKVEPSTLYYVGGTYNPSDKSYKHCNYLAEYDADGEFIQWNTFIDESFTTNANTRYIRFSYSSAVERNRVYFGTTVWNGQSYIPYSPKIKSDYLPKVELMPRQFAISGDLADGQYLYDTATANSICRNERIMFNCDITSFTKVEIGYAWYSTSYKYNRITIDTEKLTAKNYSGVETEYTHGLTITNNLQVLVESNFFRGATITIISNGEMYSVTDSTALDRRRVAFLYAQSVGSTLPNSKLSWTCQDFDKPIWIFGDSYVASTTNKWVYYINTYHYGSNVLWDAYPGEGSEGSYESLTHLLTLAKPEMIVWCLGMNDGSDTNDTPSTSWLNVQDSLRALCESMDIELILATIPSVPSINHEAKNANVRASGYRYIDFAKAVGATPAGVWYGDMLSSDEVHPSATGAKALFGRVVLDLPEIMITP